MTLNKLIEILLEARQRLQGEDCTVWMLSSHDERMGLDEVRICNAMGPYGRGTSIELHQLILREEDRAILESGL